jgi:hypothetical protein
MFGKGGKIQENKDADAKGVPDSQPHTGFASGTPRTPRPPDCVCPHRGCCDRRGIILDFSMLMIIAKIL